MTTLITGGAGYIGSHVALALLDQGERVVILDNLVTGNRALVPPLAEFVEADIADVARVRQTLRNHDVTAVIHCAGSTIVPESVAAPINYYRNNTLGSLRLLEAMVAEGTAIMLFSSTAAVYRADVAGPLDEKSAVDPLTPYGQSKRFTEVIIADVAAAYGLSYCIFRYFNVAGADPAGRSGQSAPNATHLIKVAVEAAVGARPGMEVFGADWPTPDGSCIRDFIHVSDLADIHRAGLEYLARGGASAVMNCGYGKGYSVLEVIETVKRVSGVDFPVAITGRRPGDIGSVVADPNRMAGILGWQPRYSDIAGIVTNALDWERSTRARSALSLRK